MRYRLSRLALIATAALLWTGCASTRTAVSRSEELRTTELRSTESRDSVTIELRDTLKEVTTITIDRNDAGDTLRVTQVTDRDRSRSMYDVRCKTEVVRVERDTVYIAVRDSVQVTTTNVSNPTNKSSNFVRSLKWMLAIAFLLLTSVVLVRARH